MTLDRKVVLGRINGVFGIQGWLKVYSYTTPTDRILTYEPWYLERQGAWVEMKLEAGRVHGKTLVAKLKSVNDRDQAVTWIGAEIGVARRQLPQLPAGEYYWIELIGLSVVNLDGVDLGRIESMMETGANDVMVVAGNRERLIPFAEGVVVKQVDLREGTITVDWGVDY